MWKIAIVACLGLCAQGALAEDALFGPDGYRIAHYRGPVPQAPAGVAAIDAAAVASLRPGRDAVLIDVLPNEGAPRPSLPGAHWFPEAGRGVLGPGVARWFARGVARLAHGSKRRTIVTFCLADCWMSWNAARRLRAMGYTDVRWFAQGTDGWRDLGLPLTEATPEPD